MKRSAPMQCNFLEVGDGDLKQMTLSWLQKYANVNKHASYQDKLDAVFVERNAYYLLEWLIFPPSPEIIEMIHFHRSPSVAKNNYIDFTEVFFSQIIFEIGFRAFHSDKYNQLLLQTAINDLRSLYGHETWERAV